ncbi:hypothetical protein DVA86_30920 [Streptomyces armeniacus]|uniref:DUF5709 domain-containing protein n=1 Tax=Streptomyces armeniacus TaxID=83291 RepID=A0A345XXH6_9ACTN|nr:DUF5709 domain-containing protein [Streptomyces armeniacus]AXK36342.1 hypothetical protein DVA86_30920 [Streptomyces armeniacus]
MASSDMGDEVYQPDESEVQEDTNVLEPEDTLVDRGLDSALDEGYSPPEKPLAVESHGTTGSEQLEGESLDERLSREVPDAGEAPGRETAAGGDEDVTGEDVADEDMRPPAEELPGGGTEGDRAGRLVAPDEGAHPDEEKDVVGADVGIDGAAASAEEAAVRVGPEPGPENPEPYGNPEAS